MRIRHLTIVKHVQDTDSRRRLTRLTRLKQCHGASRCARHRCRMGGRPSHHGEKKNSNFKHYMRQATARYRIRSIFATMTDDTTDLRLECVCTTVSILSSGVDESTMSGVGKLLTRYLEETLSGHRRMATGAIIDVLCREDGPIARFHVSNSQNALYIRVLGVTTTWHPRAAAPNRKKIFTCLLQRVSIHKGLNESEIEKCNMQARNGIKGAISMIDIEVCCHWRTDTVGPHLISFI